MAKKTTTEIVPAKKVPTKRSKQHVIKTEIVSPEALIMQAMNQGASFETIKEMLDLKERIQKQEAEKMFRIAMSKFQAECPVIIKSNGVDYTSKKSGTRVKYNYASLDKIIAAVKGLLGKYELSYTFTTNQSETSVTAICHAFHIAGHVESTLFTVPVDLEAYMNAAQKVASALTYAKRYAFCNAFGILTGDIDDDANALSPEDKKQNTDQKAKEAKDQLKRFIENNSYIEEAFEIIEYEDRAQWAFCNGHQWKVDLIKKHLEQLIGNKK